MNSFSNMVKISRSIRTNPYLKKRYNKLKRRRFNNINETQTNTVTNLFCNIYEPPRSPKLITSLCTCSDSQRGVWCDYCSTKIDEELYGFSEDKIFITCPLCKKENTILSTQQRAFVDSDCCVCMERKADVFFPNCGHICICNNCMSNMKKA